MRKHNSWSSAATKQPDGQITKTLSTPSRKNFPLPSSGKSVIQICPSRPIRGALRTSRTLRWDAVDADAGGRRTPGTRGRAKSCGPGAPTLASSFREARFSGVTVAKEPGHRGEHEVSRKPLRRESRRCSGSPVVLPPCFFVARGPWVQSAPGFPCALTIVRGTKRHARLGHVVPRGYRLVPPLLFEM